LRGPSLEEGRPWVDTGIDLTGLDPRIYLSQTAVETAARLYHWSPPEEVAALREEIAELKVKLAAAEQQAEDLDGLFNAIDALESAGMRARKKPGRPKTHKDHEKEPVA
jgi:hypothetical protein